jgi:hypothetical protein
MASYPPPTEDLPIFDISAFGTTSVLTESTADKLYLSKTEDDIAEGTITFNTSIKTNKINSIGSLDTVALFNNPSGNIVINNSSSKSNVVAISNATLQNSKIRMASGDGAVGEVDIGNGSQSSVEINIGSGNLSINDINIGGSSSQVNLGKGGTTINVNGAFNTTDYEPIDTNSYGYLYLPDGTGAGTIMSPYSFYTIMTQTVTKGLYLVSTVVQFAGSASNYLQESLLILRRNGGSIMNTSITGVQCQPSTNNVIRLSITGLAIATADGDIIDIIQRCIYASGTFTIQGSSNQIVKLY